MASVRRAPPGAGEPAGHDHQPDPGLQDIGSANLAQGSGDVPGRGCGSGSPSCRPPRYWRRGHQDRTGRPGGALPPRGVPLGRDLQPHPGLERDDHGHPRPLDRYALPGRYRDGHPGTAVPDLENVRDRRVRVRGVVGAVRQVHAAPPRAAGAPGMHLPRSGTPWRRGLRTSSWRSRTRVRPRGPSSRWADIQVTGGPVVPGEAYRGDLAIDNFTHDGTGGARSPVWPTNFFLGPPPMAPRPPSPGRDPDRGACRDVRTPRESPRSGSR